MTSGTSKTKTVHVLLVEDNDVDREAVRRAFTRHRIANPIYDARDGVEALELLRGMADKPRLPRPFLILLDINMPRMSGIELLHELRADPDLRDTEQVPLLEDGGVGLLGVSTLDVGAHRAHVDGAAVHPDFAVGPDRDES